MTAKSGMIIFGATGDLALRMLLPSLYGLDADGLLSRDYRILGTARSALDREGYIALVGVALRRHIDSARLTSDRLKIFLARIDYIPLDVTNIAGYSHLTAALGANIENLSIFLSTAPALFGPTIEGLVKAGLSSSRAKLALEKPLGSDLATSRLINDAVAVAFPEERTFRVDHYLGKETVQNLLTLRFGNALFEPLWNASNIDNIRITVAETVGLEGRVGFYDDAGAMRDMVQNHMLQLLALTAMEPPSDFEASAVRSEKVKVLRALRRIDLSSVQTDTVIGQYGPGEIGQDAVRGYVEELGHPSETETFVAIRAHIDNWRWKGVPFFLRTGKRLAERRTEIRIQFKDVPHSIFARRGGVLLPNKLVIRLQPEENIRLLLMAKQPGLDRAGVRLREVPLEIGIDNAFTDVRRRIAYERLLLDLIDGDPTLFVRRDEVEAQWEWVDAIRDGWKNQQMRPEPYPAGSWGPLSAVALPERN